MGRGDNMYTWMGADYAGHNDMRSHTLGTLQLGWGTLHCKSTKLKLNTKSYTEAELVGLSKYITYNLWVVMFINDQGSLLNKTIFYQENMSTTKMQINGRN